MKNRILDMQNARKSGKKLLFVAVGTTASGSTRACECRTLAEAKMQLSEQFFAECHDVSIDVFIDR